MPLDFPWSPSELTTYGVCFNAAIKQAKECTRQLCFEDFLRVYASDRHQLIMRLADEDLNVEDCQSILSAFEATVYMTLKQMHICVTGFGK